MDEHQTTDEFANRLTLLMAVRDTGMWQARDVNREEVFILSHEHTILTASKCELLNILGAKQSLVRRCRYIHTSKPEPKCHSGVDMFVKMKPDLHLPTGLTVSAA